MLTKAVVFARVVVAIAATVLVVTSILQSEGVIPANKILATWVTYGSLFVIAVDNIATLIRRSARDRRIRRDQEISAALMALLLSMCAKPELRFEKLGACVYVVNKRWWRRWRWKQEPELVRIARFRPAGYPQQSGVTWRPGTGAVGSAWRDRKTTYRNLNNVARRWGAAEISDEAFERISKSARGGFTREDFVSIVGKYAEVLAEPIWDHRSDKKCIGVVALDLQYEGEAPVTGSPLNHPDSRGYLSASAALLGTVLNKPKTAR